MGRHLSPWRAALVGRNPLSTAKARPRRGRTPDWSEFYRRNCNCGQMTDFLDSRRRDASACTRAISRYATHPKAHTVSSPLNRLLLQSRAGRILIVPSPPRKPVFPQGHTCLSQVWPNDDETACAQAARRRRKPVEIDGPRAGMKFSASHVTNSRTNESAAFSISQANRQTNPHGRFQRLPIGSVVRGRASRKR